jgi:hypothetical protein
MRRKSHVRFGGRGGLQGPSLSLRLRRSVDMTSNVKSGLPIVLHFLSPVSFRPSEEAEPVRHDG